MIIPSVDNGDLSLELLEGIPDPAAILDSSGRVLLHNAQWRKLSHLLEIDIEFFTGTGGNLYDLIHLLDNPKIKEDLDRVFGLQSRSLCFEFGFCEHFEERSFSAFLKCLGRASSCFILVLKDTTEMMGLRNTLKSIIYEDSLTGAGNENAFNLFLYNKIYEARNSGSSFFLFCLEVDRVREIIAMFGKRVADAFLLKISKRLSIELKENRLFRVQYDTFVGILEFSERDSLSRFLTCAFPDIEKTIVFQNLELKPTIKVGVCQFPVDGETADDLLSNCFGAIYRAKRDEVRWSFYG